MRPGHAGAFKGDSEMTKTPIQTKPQDQNPKPPYDIRERTMEFTLRIIDRKWPQMNVRGEIDEAFELMSILSAIIFKLS